MGSFLLQAVSLQGRRVRTFATVGAVVLATSGCLSRSPEVTGSIGGPQDTPAAQETWRRQADVWGPRFAAHPDDASTALNYARALRATDQKAQALAVLQQAAIRNPKALELLAAYGKALADVGRYKEAADVLSGAHLPERPDWRILSAQGAIADQMDDHAQAQRYYETALKMVPGEPSVLSNLGLSYALSKRLGDAERVLKEAAAGPNADARVRQNLALVLGLQGKFADAEGVLRRDLSPAEAAANVGVMRSLVTQQNSWKALRGAVGKQPARAAEEPNG